MLQSFYEMDERRFSSSKIFTNVGQKVIDSTEKELLLEIELRSNMLKNIKSPFTQLSYIIHCVFF